MCGLIDEDRDLFRATPRKRQEAPPQEPKAFIEALAEQLVRFNVPC